MTQAEILIQQNALTRAEVVSLVSGRTASIRFEKCTFDGEDLSRLDLRACTFIGCSVAEVSFARSQLESTRWLGCKARSCDFSLADLTDARMQDCDLNNSVWARARLASVIFEGVKLTGASFLEIAGLGLEFRNCLLVAADLRGLSFRKQRLFQLDLSDADLGGCDFRDAHFDGGSLIGASLKRARFDGADLRRVDLGKLTADNVASFRHATISFEQAAALASAFGLLVA